MRWPSLRLTGGSGALLYTSLISAIASGKNSNTLKSMESEELLSYVGHSIVKRTGGCIADNRVRHSIGDNAERGERDGGE